MAAYLLTAFGDVSLPIYNPVADLSSGPVPSALRPSVGGMFDIWGDSQRLPDRQVIEYTGFYLGELTYLVNESGTFIVTDTGAYIIAGEAENMLRSQVDALNRMLGQRDKLYRQRADDDELQWKYARLLNVEQQTKQEHLTILAEVRPMFETAAGAWSSEDAVTTSEGCTAGTNALTVSNAGMVQINDAVFTFTASASVTSVRVECVAMGIDWTWTGTLSSGQALVVDAGAQTVRKAGSNSYSGFVFNSAHSAAGLLPLDPGTNPLVVTVDGSGTAKVEHYDQWL